MVRDARHAYLGAVSYVDDHLARLLEILRVTGRLENTVVILTSDHGDMQGERGLWYKMSFYEGSARVPLVVSAPGRFEPSRVASPVSTMDLLPTLVGIAGGDDEAAAEHLDAESLLPLLRGDHDDRDVVVGQYLAEGAIAPIVMFRRGSWKLIHSPADPDQLFDLADRPAGADQPRRGPGRRRDPRRAPAPRSPRAGTSTGSTRRCVRASAAGGSWERRSRSGPAARVGLRPAVRRGAPLHPQPHGPRRPRGDGPLPVRHASPGFGEGHLEVRGHPEADVPGAAVRRVRAPRVDPVAPAVAVVAQVAAAAQHPGGARTPAPWARRRGSVR